MTKVAVASAILVCLLVAVDTCDYANCRGGKRYTKCELARDLISEGVSRSEVAHWVCEAEHESQFCTCAVNTSSRHYGIFQINAFWNCDYGQRTNNGSNTQYTAFIDTSLADDITCMRQILIWLGNDWSAVSYGYRDHCPDIISTYLDDCNL